MVENGLGYDDFADKAVGTLSQPPAVIRAGDVVGLQEIGRELQLHEPVVGHVLIQGPDHPVAVQVGVGITKRAIVADDVGLVLAIARHVEPHARPVLAEVRRGQEVIDDPFVRIR